MSGQSSILDQYSTAQLLQVKICDLKLSLKQSPIQLLIGQLYAEIARKGLCFKPEVWISTSWFSPYGVPGFALPFYLLHPRLAELEKKYVGEVEGGTDAWCMQLLRHETGHAIDNAFLLRLSKRRQMLFGLSGEPYPTRYLPQTKSTDFVRHLENHYAQAHPDEDWAESFAIWLDPKSNWRSRYSGTKALDKLHLVDELLKSVVGMKQKVHRIDRLDDASTCDQTLIEYFESKQQKYRKLASPAKQRHNTREEVMQNWISM
jgi:hypothetical protein